MASFDPPSIRPDAAPEFKDSAACAKWLQTLPLVNVGPSHDRILGQLEQLNACNIAPAERLKIMELLREPVTFVQKELSKKFSTRPAPLAKLEREIFHKVNALWDSLSNGYQHCLPAVAGGASGVSAGLVCQRALWCTGQKLLACYGAYQDVGEREWKMLHGVYAFAEERKVAADGVAHPVRENGETNCVETYAQVLLLHLASPSKLTPRQIELISLWLESWARKISIGPAASAAGDGPARRAPEGEKIRVLDIQEVGESVRKRVGLLKKGETPAALGLGEEVTASLAQSLLVMLYRRWCEEGQSRAYPRHGASGTAQICSGMAAVQQFVTGGTFRMPGASRELSQVQHEQIATLGRVATRQDERVPAANFVAETWQIKDESASGVRLQRVDPAATSRLVLGQLLGIRLADAKAFLLCTVRWLSVSPRRSSCPRAGSSRSGRSRCTPTARDRCDSQRSSTAAPISSGSRSRRPRASLPFIRRRERIVAAADRPTPTEIKLHQKSRVLEVSFSDGSRFELPYEFLRVHSPSAEVRGHGPGQEVLQSGKKEVDILSLEPVGSYAVQPHFSDGHGTGIYSWDYLRELGANRESLWQAYLKRLEAAGARREP